MRIRPASTGPSAGGGSGAPAIEGLGIATGDDSGVLVPFPDPPPIAWAPTPTADLQERPPMARGNESAPTDWVTRAADDVDAARRRDRPSSPCASGASPSGPIHLGNLREFLTPHFVAEELRRRGLAVRHLHCWDDYDRFRKVPAGVAPGVGRAHRPPALARSPTRGTATPPGPSTSRPRCARRSPRWASRWRRSARPRCTAPAPTASRSCARSSAATRSRRCSPSTAPRRAGGRDRAGGRRARRLGRPRRGARLRRPGPLPVQAVVRQLRPRHHDRHVLRRRHAPTSPTPAASCGYTGATDLATEDGGKLVWKVDWPMRWAYEGVDFEPAGLDHMTPGSSYTVGQELVSSIFDWRPPARVTYAFVGFAGVQKMSSSAGGVPTARRRARASSRRRSCAGSTSAARPSRPSTSTSGRRSSGCTTSGTP